MSKNLSIITLHEEIKIIGLSYQKLGLPGTTESLEKMWCIYGVQYRGKIKHAVVPLIDYGVNACLTTDKHEYIAGCAVTEIDTLDKNWSSYVVPPGRYIKYTRCKMAELFEGHDDIKAWADTNGILLNPDLMVEVYPAGVHDDAGGKDTKAYLLFPILEG